MTNVMTSRRLRQTVNPKDGRIGSHDLAFMTWLRLETDDTKGLDFLQLNIRALFFFLQLFSDYVTKRVLF